MDGTGDRFLELAYKLGKSPSVYYHVSSPCLRKFDKFECPTGCSVTSASVHGDPMFKVNGIAAGAKDELA